MVDIGCIYKITNNINNKVYIGKTCFTAEKRWSRHLYEAKREKIQYALYEAIRKYGANNFSIETIEIVDDELLSEREIYWINYYDSFIKNGIGYNETLGGEGNSLIDRSEIEKLWDDGLSIKQICDVLGNDRSSVRSILSGYDKYSIEESNRRGDLIQGLERWKKVLQYDLEGNYLNTYNNLKDAEIYTGISSKSIWHAVNHICSNAGGYQWRYIDDNDKPANIKNTARRYKCPVLQFDLDGNFIKKYLSAAEAERETNINSICIRKVCQGKSLTAGGYKWIYEGGDA